MANGKELEARIAALESGLESAQLVTQELHKRIVALEEKGGALNKSSPMKRNMTDDDARSVMTGDEKVLDHKEAADARGLTYAQVYSCRLEYTFKHIHKQLRESGFKNPWTR